MKDAGEEHWEAAITNARVKRTRTVKLPPVGRPVGSKRFLDSVQAALDEEHVGRELARLFMTAIDEKDTPLLKAMLPYVLGRPERVREEGSVETLQFVLEGMRNARELLEDRDIEEPEEPDEETDDEEESDVIYGE